MKNFEHTWRMRIPLLRRKKLAYDIRSDEMKEGKWLFVLFISIDKLQQGVGIRLNWGWSFNG